MSVRQWRGACAGLAVRVAPHGAGVPPPAWGTVKRGRQAKGSPAQSELLNGSGCFSSSMFISGQQIAITLPMVVRAPVPVSAMRNLTA